MKVLKVIPIVALALTGAVAAPGLAGASHTSHTSHGYTCSGGNVPAGVYNSMWITGVCYMPAGTVIIKGDLTIEEGALLDAVTAGDPVAAPVLPATVKIWGDVKVESGGVLAMGCSPAGGCTGVAYDRIGGDVTAWGAEAVLLQEVSVGGDVSIIGGGGGVAGGAASGGCFSPTYAIPAPWSLDPALSNPTTGSPQYTDLEDSTIGGNLTIKGVQTCYLASFRDRVGGSITFMGNTTSDPDGNELGSNLVSGDLRCLGNLPYIQFGDATAAPNVVWGHASGGCGFGVVLNNSGAPEHISVPAWSLSKSWGTHTTTSTAKTINFGTTAAGDQLLGQLNNVTLAGSGLTGTLTVDLSMPPGQTGEAVLSTVHPDGSASFEAELACTCSYQGHTGTVRVIAYGTTTEHGLTTGTFLVASGGPGNGGLATLAGWGTFTSDDQPTGTLALREHLRLT